MNYTVFVILVLVSLTQIKGTNGEISNVIEDLRQGNDPTYDYYDSQEKDTPQKKPDNDKDNFEKKMQELNKKVEEVKKKIKEAEDQKTLLEGATKTVNEIENDVKGNITELEKAMPKNDTAIKLLKEQLRRIEEVKTTNAMAYEGLIKKLEALKSELDKKEKEIEEEKKKQKEKEKEKQQEKEKEKEKQKEKEKNEPGENNKGKNFNKWHSLLFEAVKDKLSQFTDLLQSIEEKTTQMKKNLRNNNEILKGQTNEILRFLENKRRYPTHKCPLSKLKYPNY
ncbi:hypothetical protein RUM44_011501 [Polyplax serrata]|uniref:Uncharacterized protein n=1 Tax=Polyplax serrata TaxID=468196 RepID=A0ABR1AQ80_POLSC